MDPIAVLVELHGETAELQNPPVAGAGRFDPSAPGDYQPPQPVKTTLRGVSEAKMLKEGAPPAATAAFTISTTVMPPGLQPNTSKLVWGITWVVVGYRERRFLGAINGYTLFLKK